MRPWSGLSPTQVEHAYEMGTSELQRTSIMLAAARRKGCVTFNLAKFQTEEGRMVTKNYLLFGEKVVELFYKLPGTK